MAAISLADAKASAASFDWAAWSKKLQTLYAPIYRAMVVSQGAVSRLAGEAARKKDERFNVNDPYTKRFMTNYIGARIKQIDDTTREWVNDTIGDAIASDEGATVSDLASTLSDAAANSRAFDPSRALTIARTEMAIAYNHGAALGYKQAGIEQVEVSDGDGDDECAAADGEIWSIEDALANPIEHPNCTRSFASYVEDDSKSRTPRSFGDPISWLERDDDEE